MWECESGEGAQCRRPQPHAWDEPPELPLESVGKGGGVFGCGTVWKAGGGKFSFPTHKTADFFVAVTTML